MLNIIWIICSLVLVFLIVIRVSNKENGVQNFAISGPMSPQKTDESLTNLIWILCLLFICLTSISTLKQNF